MHNLRWQKGVGPEIIYLIRFRPIDRPTESGSASLYTLGVCSCVIKKDAYTLWWRGSQGWGPWCGRRRCSPRSRCASRWWTAPYQTSARTRASLSLNTKKIKYLRLVSPVLRIHGILVWIRIRGSMPLTNGSGSFYFHHWPSSFQHKTNLKKSFSVYYFLKVLIHHFSKVKSKKEVTKQ